MATGAPALRGPVGFVVEHLHLAELGQRLEQGRGWRMKALSPTANSGTRGRRQLHLAAQVAAGVDQRLQLAPSRLRPARRSCRGWLRG